MQEKQLPDLPFDAGKVSYLDGLKIYFANGGWISVRFSGTEPLLRIFCEMTDREDAVKLYGVFEEFLHL